MADALNIYYWDACIFYEHLTDEPVERLKKQAIDLLLKENKEKRNRICTSVITHTEVIPKKLDGREKAYWERFDSMYFFDIPLERNIIILGREIKDYYYKPPDDRNGYRIMSTGDALHLATAIIHNVSEFCTRDKNSKGGNVKLLGLPENSPNGRVCGQYSLRVVSPEAQQGQLNV
jgi:predicted nucleic acid-binding protein